MGLARLQRVQDGGAELRFPCAWFAGYSGQEGKANNQYPLPAIATSNLSISLFSHVSISLSDPSIPKQGDMEQEGGWW